MDIEKSAQHGHWHTPHSILVKKERRNADQFSACIKKDDAQGFTSPEIDPPVIEPGMSQKQITIRVVMQKLAPGVAQRKKCLALANYLQFNHVRADNSGCRYDDVGGAVGLVITLDNFPGLIANYDRLPQV